MSRGKNSPFSQKRQSATVLSPLAAHQPKSWVNLETALPVDDNRWRIELLKHDDDSRNYQTDTYQRPEFKLYDQDGNLILLSGKAKPAKPYRWDEASWYIPGSNGLSRAVDLVSALPQMYQLAVEVGTWLNKPVKYNQQTENEAEALNKKWLETLYWKMPWANGNESHMVKYDTGPIWEVKKVISKLDHQERIICRSPKFNYGSGDQYAALWFETDTPMAALQAEYAALAPMLFMMLDNANSEVSSRGYYSRNGVEGYSRQNRKADFEARDLFVHLQEHARVYKELRRGLASYKP